MQLHDVHQGIHRRKKRKRIGRGIGSGHGKTSTKGHKGHASRQGFKLSPIFEGGQMPLARRVPKRGFVNGAFKKSYAIVNLADLDARFEAGAVVDEKALRARGLVKGHEFDGIKILGDGAISKPLEVHATKFSATAAQKIAAAGGKTVVVAYKPHAIHARSQV
ncbi:MAG: 50S ribosomal protein L15 [Isosphaeraceae bacterium]